MGEERPIPTSLHNSDDDGLQVLGLLGSNLTSPKPLRISLGNLAITSKLCEIYLQQVDPIIKILHRPSLSKWLMLQGQYLAYAKGNPATEALGAAVCFAAISSMTESQCSIVFHAKKSDLVIESRATCEMAIGRAGLLSTRDITVLQAFVLYLVQICPQNLRQQRLTCLKVARRTVDRTQAVWTLVAVAVRISKGLGLHLDPENETFFKQQMRRRLWFTVCLLDLQASFFQASEPLIGVDDSTSTDLPQHINDLDFDPTTTSSEPSRKGLTDTTFALVTYHAQQMGRLLNFARQDRKAEAEDSITTSSRYHPRHDDSELPQQMARCFEEEALRLLHFCDPEASAYAWFTWHGTQTLIMTARLAEMRPLQRSGKSPPPRREGNPDLLRLCLLVLEKAYQMHTNFRAEGFRWYVTIPWHALAIAMAECYVSSDSSLVQQAWPLVEKSYLHHEATQGQSPDTPLGQWMRRTREKLAMAGPVSLGNPMTPGQNSINPVPSRRDLSQSLNDSRIESDRTWPHTGPTMPADLDSSSLLPLSNWCSISPALDNSSPFAAPPTMTGVVDGIDPGAETMWEELFSGMPFNEIAGPDMFFFESGR
ncbi:C6 transcription factor [Penicillium coprophilum]|uniref:C6 transcription factor n=1 Tax=Penicillium coprophilum TaxID=36646 RepID=UPI0023856656|nr:C6 transcription factor [Penicillium coprophilum]KAJ5173530.1 C6 transcription factor [Penicillium coprophilum]